MPVRHEKYVSSTVTWELANNLHRIKSLDVVRVFTYRVWIVRRRYLFLVQRHPVYACEESVVFNFIEVLRGSESPSFLFL